jgi:hypothetical protein
LIRNLTRALAIVTVHVLGDSTLILSLFSSVSHGNGVNVLFSLLESGADSYGLQEFELLFRFKTTSCCKLTFEFKMCPFLDLAVHWATLQNSLNLAHEMRTSEIWGSGLAVHMLPILAVYCSNMFAHLVTVNIPCTIGPVPFAVLERAAPYRF